MTTFVLLAYRKINELEDEDISADWHSIMQRC